MTLWADARSHALTALASACGEALIHRRAESQMEGGPDAIEALEYELASIDSPATSDD